MSGLVVQIISLFTYIISMIMCSSLVTTVNGQADLQHEHVHMREYLHNRLYFSELCEKMKFKVGAELGVQEGIFSKYMLDGWPSCEKYLLVDIWGKQNNYLDIANVDQLKQDRLYQNTLERLKFYKTKLVIHRNYTSSAVLLIENESLDFIYVDARHDYCGAMEDMVNWWPKLKYGGIMAGHDYMTAEYQRVGQRNQKVPPEKIDDWGLCGDGKTRNEGAVKGAVDDFAKLHNSTVLTTVNDGPWRSWIFPPKRREHMHHHHHPASPLL